MKHFGLKLNLAWLIGGEGMNGGGLLPMNKGHFWSAVNYGAPLWAGLLGGNITGNTISCEHLTVKVR